MQTCAGNTGARSAGTVTTGTVSGNGASVPVTFVGGDINSQMEWGNGAIPNAYTVCSVTRYSGTRNMRILTGYSSSTGSKFSSIDWLHGHVDGKTGVFYSTQKWHGQLNLLSPVTQWVVGC